MASDDRDLGDQPLPWDLFERLRRENLSRWPTGADVDLPRAVERHLSLPAHKRCATVMRAAQAAGQTLTQPRGGFGTFPMHLELLRTLQEEGCADILPTTTDSYTRNERFAEAERGMLESERLGRSLLNGLPVVNLGVARCAELIDAVDRPIIVLSGTAMPRLTAEITLAAGFTAYLGSGIAYTASYTKDVSIAQGIRNYQYLDRLTALYAEHGVEIHRRQPGFLTGTLVPPGIAIAVAVLDCLLAAAQGVRDYGLELGQCLSLAQDVAAIQVCAELCQEYLCRFGHPGVFTPVTSLHWMGAWPHDEAQATALIAYGGMVAALGGAVSVTTKSTHEAVGIPTKEVNAQGLRATRMAIRLTHGLRLDGLPQVEEEKALIRREVRAIVDRVVEMGEGDVAVGVVRACEAGILDVPWSPNRWIRSRVLPARDHEGAIRWLSCGDLPLPPEVREFHAERLRRRAEAEGRPLDVELAIADVYGMTEPVRHLDLATLAAALPGSRDDGFLGTVGGKPPAASAGGS
jgi:methylaspartate mutase epsilon subunit